MGRRPTRGQLANASSAGAFRNSRLFKRKRVADSLQRGVGERREWHLPDFPRVAGSAGNCVAESAGVSILSDPPGTAG